MTQQQKTGRWQAWFWPAVVAATAATYWVALMLAGGDAGAAANAESTRTAQSTAASRLDGEANAAAPREGDVTHFAPRRSSTLLAYLADDKDNEDADAKPKRQSPRQLVGIDVIEQRLGDKTPTGTGVAMGHVEGGGAQYLPNTNAAHFRGVDFKVRSGVSKVSGHANATARVIYGPLGLAPGVTDVHLYSAGGWLGEQGLRVPALVRRRQQDDDADDDDKAASLTPTADGRRVFTHSWISSGSEDEARMVLRRLDSLIEKENVIVVAGVNNNGSSSVPHLLGSSYNAIAVGVTGRRSSSGYTRVEGEGRCKPDLVVNMSKTSFSTPVVAALAARLLEQADRMTASAEGADDMVKHAGDARVIKAVLMAGADKSCGFEPDEGRPLDQHHGAGAARFDHSYDILAAGPVAPGDEKADRLAGWSFDSIAPGETDQYALTITQPLAELSIMLVWHRQADYEPVPFTDPNTNAKRFVWKPQRMADLNLGLVQPDSDNPIVARSISKVDNVEHIYVKDLKPGTYRINILRAANDRPANEAWEYAVAWRGVKAE